MARLLTILTEVRGSKVVLHAQLKNKDVAKCVLTWFAPQQTAHVWLSAPALYPSHGVTTFQKFHGSLQELQDHYSKLFHELVMLLVPVVQGCNNINMLTYKLQGVHPHVSALVRCLLALKKNVHVNKKRNDQKKIDALHSQLSALSLAGPSTASTASTASNDPDVDVAPQKRKKRDGGHRVDDSASNSATVERSEAADARKPARVTHSFI